MKNRLPIKRGLYLHYKGGIYLVLWEAYTFRNRRTNDRILQSTSP